MTQVQTFICAPQVLAGSQGTASKGDCKKPPMPSSIEQELCNLWRSLRSHQCWKSQHGLHLCGVTNTTCEPEPPEQRTSNDQPSASSSWCCSDSAFCNSSICTNLIFLPSKNLAQISNPISSQSSSDYNQLQPHCRCSQLRQEQSIIISLPIQEVTGHQWQMMSFTGKQKDQRASTLMPLLPTKIPTIPAGSVGNCLLIPSSWGMKLIQLKQNCKRIQEARQNRFV